MIDRKDPDYIAARERAVQYIGSNFSKSRQQVKDKVIRAGYDSALAQQVADDLQAIDYCSDIAAARNLLKRHQGRKGKGDRYLEYLLEQKGIPREVAEQALSEIPDEAARLAEVVESYASSLKGKGPIKARRFLTGRGFAYYLIDRELENIFYES